MEKGGSLKRNITNTIKNDRVLILVLMEKADLSKWITYGVPYDIVLILVIMEKGGSK